MFRRKENPTANVEHDAKKCVVGDVPTINASSGMEGNVEEDIAKDVAANITFGDEKFITPHPTRVAKPGPNLKSLFVSSFGSMCEFVGKKDLKFVFRGGYLFDENVDYVNSEMCFAFHEWLDIGFDEKRRWVIFCCYVDLLIFLLVIDILFNNHDFIFSLYNGQMYLDEDNVLDPMFVFGHDKIKLKTLFVDLV